MALSPAQVVCRKFGGATELARLLGLRPASISYWESRGRGRIPSKQQPRLLRLAHKHNIHLTPDELINGAAE